jgi:hypothetical protein
MITQTTFDEMVKENIEEFEMTKEEALVETVKQLSSMGRDLSTIDITGGEGRKQILAVIGTLNDLSPNLISELSNLEVLCSDRSQDGRKNQNIFRASGGCIAALNVIAPTTDFEILRAVLDFLSGISRANGERIAHKCI